MSVPRPRIRSFLTATLLLLSVANTPAASDAPFFDPADEARIDAVLRQLSLEEKVHLLHGTGMFFSGGVERLGLRELRYTDGPLGIREEIERSSWAAAGREDDFATYFPTGTALAATWNPELAHAYGSAIGAEARARGKDVLLAPAINVIRTPLCGRNYEYFSEEPALIAALAAPYVRGVQTHDVAACVKHYVANNQETDRSSISVEMDQRTLHEVYLRGFRAAVVEGEAGAVMGAYNRFRGTYVCEHPYLLREVLKDDWDFPGIVVSDWNATHSTVPAARAGLDVEMGTAERDFEEFYFAQPLLEAVREGELGESVVDGMARRVLRVMLACELDDPAQQAEGAINTEHHARIVGEVAREAIVLLKNEEELLPLDPAGLRSVAVIGDNATRQQSSGGFGAGVKAAYEVTPLEGLREALGEGVELRFAQGYRPQYGGDPDGRLWQRPIIHQPDPELLAEAVAAARDSDLAIVVAGTNRDVESEAADRPDLRLPFGQEELIAAVREANPRTIVVVVAGAAVDLTRVEQDVSTLVWAWFNGSESGHALADVLTGATNPSGKLPFTLPRQLEDLGPHALDAWPGDGETVHYEEGLLVGYRWLDAQQIEPLYPFGYGRSYTEFQLAEARLERPRIDSDEAAEITLSLANTGARDGQETLQVYASFPQSAIARPPRQLVGFQKVAVRAGEQTEVRLSIPASAFAYYDPAQARWQIPAGPVRLHLGHSSRDLPLTLELEIVE